MQNRGCSNDPASASTTPLTLRPSTVDVQPLLVACLCARWCSLCAEYGAVFRALALAEPAAARYRWVDIEDDEAVLGPVEVDDFPTILIARGASVLFFGPLTPQPAILARLVDRARSGALAPVAAPEITALAVRLAVWPGASDAGH